MNHVEQIKTIDTNSVCLQIETEFITGQWLRGLRDVLNISQEVMTSQLFSGIIGRETLTRYENGTRMISDSNRVLIALLLKARLDSVPLKKRKNSGHRMV